MNIFYKHDWELKTETVTKSKWQHTLEEASKAQIGKTHLPAQLCDADRKHIQVFTCKKCGKFKRFVETI